MGGEVGLMAQGGAVSDMERMGEDIDMSLEVGRLIHKR